MLFVHGFLPRALPWIDWGKVYIKNSHFAHGKCCKFDRINTSNLQNSNNFLPRVMSPWADCSIQNREPRLNLLKWCCLKIGQDSCILFFHCLKIERINEENIPTESFLFFMKYTNYMENEKSIYSSTTNPMFGSHPKGWQRVFIKIESILLIPYALSIIFIPLIIVLTADYTTPIQLVSAVLIVMVSIFITSISFIVLISLFKTIRLSISSKGIIGDFSKLGIFCKIRERRVWTYTFIGWDEIKSIYVSSFKTIHVITKNGLEQNSSVENVLDFVKALKKSGHSNKFDLKRSKSLLGFNWGMGKGLLGMHQSSKKFSQLSDQMDEALK